VLSTRTWKNWGHRLSQWGLCGSGVCIYHCNALQRTATHLNSLQQTLQHTVEAADCPNEGSANEMWVFITATHCNSLQRTLQHAVEAIDCPNEGSTIKVWEYIIVTHCNTLQRTATHCNTLQLYVYIYIYICIYLTHWNTLPRKKKKCDISRAHTRTHTHTHTHIYKHTHTHTNDYICVYNGSVVRQRRPSWFRPSILRSIQNKEKRREREWETEKYRTERDFTHPLCALEKVRCAEIFMSAHCGDFRIRLALTDHQATSNSLNSNLKKCPFSRCCSDFWKSFF